MDNFLFETHTLIAALEKVFEPVTFLRDRYFPTDEVDIFSTDDILVEYREGNKKLAPFVSPRKGGVNVARNGYTMTRYTPPFIAPKRSLTIDELKKKGFGEALFSKLTPEERASAYALKDVSELRDLISRREEAMSAEVMLHNKCTMKQIEGLEGDEKATFTDEVFYYSEEHNPATYTTAAPWDGSSTHIIKDLEAMARMLTRNGLPVADLVCSPDVADAIINADEIQKIFDIRNYAVGRVEPKKLADSAAIVANLTILGRNIDIISYDENYTDDDGEDKLFIPSGFCVLTAPRAGHTLYGAVTQMEQSDGEYHTYAHKRVTKYYADAKDNVREITVSSRPLPAPKAKNCFISAQVLTTE